MSDVIEVYAPSNATDHPYYDSIPARVGPAMAVRGDLAGSATYSEAVGHSATDAAAVERAARTPASAARDAAVCDQTVRADHLGGDSYLERRPSRSAGHGRNANTVRSSRWAPPAPRGDALTQPTGFS